MALRSKHSRGKLPVDRVVSTTSVSEPLTLVALSSKLQASVESVGFDLKRELNEKEAVIARGWATFIEVGAALKWIRDSRSYRDDYASFDEYLNRRWGVHRTYAHRLISASDVATSIAKFSKVVPQTESQARALLHLPQERLESVWRKVESAAKTQTITAALVLAAVSEETGVAEDRESALPARVPRADIKKLLEYLDYYLREEDLEEARTTVSKLLSLFGLTSH